ncbi:myosin-binding protein 1-like [Dendrobium catenatum]|uniref:GTD-binding domain-containing protein n=1 Tax=Dendrobium catenatum TaxID=906689 RepID=A0A2I0VDJ9_9ASPA|nr:myosin-binding protein 1-like [Dendrobium catenatum]PKU61473.1 hypothetical protein MA16_Dca021530 [Dendrobium catenatum]
MAARSSTRERSELHRFSTALSSAFTEWLLILLLLVDAFCLYLLIKIFRYSKLQTPCLVCSRFTYLLGNEKLGFYNDFLCDVHKLEISTFAFCHVHKKLADAREMCETCLPSFAENKSSMEICKFLWSKQCVNPDDEMVKVPLLENDQEGSSLHKKPCSCCSKLCNIKRSAYRPFEDKPIFKELAHPAIQLSSARLHSRAHFPDRLSKDRKIFSMQLAYQPGEDYGFDPHFSYRELKFSSDSELEVAYSGDDADGSNKVPRTEEVKEESVAQNLKSSTCLTDALKDLSVISDNMVLEKLIHLDPIISDVSSISNNEINEGGSCLNSFPESINGLRHGLEEINWINVEVKPTLPLSSQITSELVPTEISIVEEVDVSRTSSTPKIEAISILNLTDTSSKPDKHLSKLDGNLPFGDKVAQRIPTSTEITLSMSRESGRIHEDLKQRLFQLPTSCSLESSWTDFNFSVGKDDENKLSDTSCCNRLHSVTKRLDSDLSFVESTDGSLVSEVEGEGSVGSLKRQIEIDHKFVSNLYKELEEERNASAISANQAMAMINKLQEEKAAMQLEAMQYLRVMEEQAEYEQRKLNDQLKEREKEIKDLEAELESCRKRCWDESFAGKNLQPSYDSDESEYSTTSTPHVLKPRGRDKHHLTGITFQDFAWPPASGSIKETVLDFEDEREYILGCLRRLEKNLRLFSSADASRRNEEDDEFNDEVYAGDTESENHQNQCLNEDKRSRNCLCSLNKIDEDCPTRQFNRLEEKISYVKNLPVSVESLSLEERDSEINSNEEENMLSSSFKKKKHPKTSTRHNLVALGDEVEHLHARLEALVADRDFLERTINSLKNGKDGLQFVQEIATHLREIRKIASTQREQVKA